MPKRLLASIAVVIMVALGALFLANREPERAAKPPPAAASTSGGHGAQPTPSPEPPPETRVRKLTAAEHDRLAERIAAARARARNAPSPSRSAPSPALPGSDDDTITLEQVSPTARAALEQSIPILADCFTDKQPEQTAVVVMTMYSDPSVGMVIDTDEMTDDDGKPLPAAIDDCLRTTIESLALPPLEVGGHLPLQYSFRF